MAKGTLRYIFHQVPVNEHEVEAHWVSNEYGFAEKVDTSNLSAVYAAASMLSMECGPGIGPSASFMRKAVRDGSTRPGG